MEIIIEYGKIVLIVQVVSALSIWGWMYAADPSDRRHGGDDE